MAWTRRRYRHEANAFAVDSLVNLPKASSLLAHSNAENVSASLVLVIGCRCHNVHIADVR